MRVDTGALMALCEKTENDIRSCINTLQVGCPCPCPPRSSSSHSCLLYALPSPAVPLYLGRSIKTQCSCTYFVLRSDCY